MEEKFSSLAKTNVVRRLATCDNQLEQKEKKVSKLEEEVENLNKLVTVLTEMHQKK